MCRPFTGAWIETAFCCKIYASRSVAPSRGRGLKRILFSFLAHRLCRRPFTGAWIETRLSLVACPCVTVAPSRGRGLKQCTAAPMYWCLRRPFTGAWIETSGFLKKRRSLLRRPFTGAWIETSLIHERSFHALSPLHGGVD